MSRYNVDFQLSVDDMELIEEALRRSKSELSEQVIDSEVQPMSCDATKQASASVRQIHDLLGRLHNQKIFFRPKSGAYVGG